MNGTETAITASKVVVILDHIKNNRIEYIALMIFSHMLGATAWATDKAVGVCA